MGNTMEDFKIKEQKRKEKESQKKKANLWPRNNWSLSHLNLSYIGYFWIIQLLILLVLTVVIPYMNKNFFQLVSDNVFAIWLVLLILVTIWGIYLSIWILSHKERSQWLLLILLLPYPLQLFGYGRLALMLWPVVELLFLCVPSKSKLNKGLEDENGDETIDAS